MNSYTEITTDTDLDIEHDYEYSININIQKLIDYYQGIENKYVNKVKYLLNLTGPYKFIGIKTHSFHLYKPNMTHIFQNELNPDIELFIEIIENSNTHIVIAKHDLSKPEKHRIEDYTNFHYKLYIECNIIQHYNSEYILK